MKPTYRKSWAGNLLMWSDLTLALPSRSNEESKSKVLINRFFLVLEVCNVKASYRKSCAGNLFM